MNGIVIGRVGRMARRHRLIVRVASATLASILGASACGSGGDGNDEADRTPTTGSESSAGTPLESGLAVVDGSELVGTVFPAGVGLVRDGQDVVDNGWWATLTLTGDPVEIIAGYLDQAVAAGLDDGSPRQPSCTPSEAGFVTCSGTARTPDPSDPRSLEVTAVRGEVSGEPISHLRLRYSTLSLLWEQEEDATSSSSSVGVERPPPPDDWPPLPGSREPFDPDWAGLNVLRVVPGTVLAAHPAFGLGCEGAEWSAVLRMDGDPEAALTEYADQYRSADPIPFTMNEPDTLDVDGSRTLTTVYGLIPTADQNVTLSLVTNQSEPDQPAWLSVATCAEASPASGNP